MKLFDAVRTLFTRKMIIEFDAVEFVCERLSRRRLLNWLLGELSYFSRSTKAWAYPTHLQVEPTNQCNLRCPVCFVTNEKNHLRKGSMSRASFERLMDEVGDRLLFLHFWGWGEPFLNPEFFNMVRYAKSKGINVITSTNGHFLLDDVRTDELLDSGLDVLIVALDGTDRETYEKYRERGDFDKVIRGLRRLVQRKRERKNTSLRINLRTLATIDNEHQIPALKAMAEDIGVDLYSIKTAALNCGDETELRRRIPRTPGYCREHFDADGRPIRQRNRCKRLWNHPFILQDGTLVRCDYNTTQLVVHGNVFTDPAGFKGVWFGDSLRSARKEFLGDRVLCKDCIRNYAHADENVSHIYQIGPRVQAGPGIESCARS